MIRSILVPLDGSPFSEAALGPALALARGAGARLHIVHAREPLRPLPMEAPLLGAVDVEPLMEAAHHAYLQRVTAKAQSALRHPVSYALVEPPAVDALAEYIEGQAIDLVVMATHGRSGVVRMVLGSVAAALLERCDAPVLLVRPQQSAQKETHLRPAAPVLVPLDGSSEAELGLPPAIAIARLLGAPITLVRVVEPFRLFGSASVRFTGEASPAETSRREAAARDALERAASRVAEHADRPDTLVIVDSEPARGIMAAARTCGAGLIALATHARGGLGRVVYGSVAEQLIAHGPSPVLLCRRTPVGGRSSMTAAARATAQPVRH